MNLENIMEPLNARAIKADRLRFIPSPRNEKAVVKLVHGLWVEWRPMPHFDLLINHFINIAIGKIEFKWTKFEEDSLQHLLTQIRLYYSADLQYQRTLHVEAVDAA